MKCAQNSEFFCFADARDELVNRGWKCYLLRTGVETHSNTKRKGTALGKAARHTGTPLLQAEARNPEAQ